MEAELSRDTGSSLQTGTDSHPPLDRLVALNHRTLETIDAQATLFHLATCPACQQKMRRIEVMVSLFRRTPLWRAECPTATQLFHHASLELPEADGRLIQDHLPTCYACRDELLIFRDVRQAARAGHSAFLNPLNWRLRRTFWKHQGYLRWLLQPRWRRPIRVLLWTAAAAAVTLLIWKSVDLEMERRTSSRSASDSSYRQSESHSSTARLETEAALVLPIGNRQRYFYLYNRQRIVQLPASRDKSRWAVEQIDGLTQDPHTFRLGEPLGDEGLIVLRPLQPLSPEGQEQIEAILEQALQGSARSNAPEWSATRARIQQATKGEVWLLEVPTQTAPESWAGPEQASVPGAPGWRESPHPGVSQGSGVRRK